MHKTIERVSFGEGLVQSGEKKTRADIQIMEVTQKLLHFALLSTQKQPNPIIGEEKHKNKEEAGYVSL